MTDSAIPASCEALGNPTGFHLTPGQASDLEGAEVLLPGLLARMQALLAGKASEAQERVLNLLECAGVQAVIPPRKNRQLPRVYDEEKYKARHLSGSGNGTMSACGRRVSRARCNRTPSAVRSSRLRWPV
jgi:hypothetical protein